MNLIKLQHEDKLQVHEQSMAFRCGQNIHIVKCEVQNTKVIPKDINESTCANTKSRILKVIKITKSRNREKHSKSTKTILKIEKKTIF